MLTAYAPRSSATRWRAPGSSGTRAMNEYRSVTAIGVRIGWKGIWFRRLRRAQGAGWERLPGTCDGDMSFDPVLKRPKTEKRDVTLIYLEMKGATQVNLMAQIIGGIQQMTNETVAWLPNLLAAIVILIIGWIVGRLLGAGVAALLDRLGIDDALARTSVGQAIVRQYGGDGSRGIVKFFDLHRPVVRLPDRDSGCGERTQPRVPDGTADGDHRVPAVHRGLRDHPDRRVHRDRLVLRLPPAPRRGPADLDDAASHHGDPGLPLLRAGHPRAPAAEDRPDDHLCPHHSGCMGHRDRRRRGHRDLLLVRHARPCAGDDGRLHGHDRRGVVRR